MNAIPKTPLNSPVTDAERLIEDAQRWSHAATHWPAAKIVLTSALVDGKIVS